MSFGESMFSTWFIQKTVKVDLYVRVNRTYPQQDGHQKDLEDTKGHHTATEGGPTCRPAAPGPPVRLQRTPHRGGRQESAMWSQSVLAFLNVITKWGGFKSITGNDARNT
jgi:hypothetical protein